MSEDIYNIWSNTSKLPKTENEKNDLDLKFFKQVFENLNYDLKYKVEKNIIHDENEINLIIPFYKRIVFLQKVLTYLNSIRPKNVSITVVEHSEEKLANTLSQELGVNYIWIEKKSEKFNKSLCMNYGVINVESNDLIFYDVDLISDNNLFDNIFLNLKNKKSKVLQCFYDRTVFALNEEQTNEVLKGVELSNYPKDKEYYENIHPNATGGIIYMTKELFYNVGGFDDLLFEGWGGEDDFMKMKIELFTSFDEANEPKIFVYHMNHDREILNEKNLKFLSVFIKSYPHTKKEIVNLLSDKFRNRIFI